jgi:hypothetical protein
MTEYILFSWLHICIRASDMSIFDATEELRKILLKLLTERKCLVPHKTPSWNLAHRGPRVTDI